MPLGPVPQGAGGLAVGSSTNAPTNELDLVIQQMESAETVLGFQLFPKIVINELPEPLRSMLLRAPPPTDQEKKGYCNEMTSHTLKERVKQSLEEGNWHLVPKWDVGCTARKYFEYSDKIYYGDAYTGLGVEGFALPIASSDTPLSKGQNEDGGSKDPTIDAGEDVLHLDQDPEKWVDEHATEEKAPLENEDVDRLLWVLLEFNIQAL